MFAQCTPGLRSGTAYGTAGLAPQLTFAAAIAGCWHCCCPLLPSLAAGICCCPLLPLLAFAAAAGLPQRLVSVLTTLIVPCSLFVLLLHRLRQIQDANQSRVISPRPPLNGEHKRTRDESLNRKSRSTLRGTGGGVVIRKPPRIS